MKPTIEFKHLSKSDELEIFIKDVICKKRPNKVLVSVTLMCGGNKGTFNGIIRNLEMYYDIKKSTRFTEATKKKMIIRLIQYQISKDLENWLKVCEKMIKIKEINDWNKELEILSKKHLKNGKPYYAETLQGLIKRNKLELLTIQS